MVILKTTTDGKFEVPKYAESFKPGGSRDRAVTIFKANVSSDGAAFRLAFNQICKN